MEHSGKNIVICSDGTGNTAIKGRGTNVFKIFESVDLNSHRFDPKLPPQVAIYDDGVGTESFKLLKILGGAFGYGLSRNVRQLYKELCRIYDPRDRIYLFGFSRGAFTVRTLAGMITTCGIIDAAKQKNADEFEAAVRRAYRVYRSRYRTDLVKIFRGEPDRSVIEAFRSQYCHQGERIAFIGVWDTVDAVGLPMKIANVINKSIYQFKFPNLELSASVDHAAHALAVDDERQSFHPLLWDESKPRKNPQQILEQVWFAGAHSNVGGGYPKQGMSLVALDWIMSRAEYAGLRLVAEDRRYYHEHANVDDKLYNPRSGIGTFYRWLPRDISQVCSTSGVQPVLHLSVVERIAHGTDDYCPGNLPPNALVVPTLTHDPVRDRPALERAAQAQQVLATSHPDGRPLLHHASKAIGVGRLSYRVLLLTVLGLLAFAAASSEVSPSYSLGYAVAIGKRLIAEPMILAALLAGFAVSFLLASYADRAILQRYSQFWFTHQQALRSALKRARRNAAELRTVEHLKAG
jgi:uncharacterized protein (DUF2235 family)